MITLLAAALLNQVGPTVDFPWSGGVEAAVAVSADIIAIVKVDAERSRSTRQELVPPKEGDPPTVDRAMAAILLEVERRGLNWQWRP